MGVILKTRIVLASAVVAGILAAPAAPPAASAASPCPNADAQPQTIAPAEFESAVLCLLNGERTARGLVALRGDAKLRQAAFGHSTSMRSTGYFAHVEPDGSTFRSRIRATGYTKGARRWLVGENIAWGSSSIGTPRSMLVAWLNSPTHRANVFERRFREAGVGVEWGVPGNAGAAYGAIVTIDFGLAKRKRSKRR